MVVKSLVVSFLTKSYADDMLAALLLVGSMDGSAEAGSKRSCREKEIFKHRRQQGQFHTQYLTLRNADDGSFEKYLTIGWKHFSFLA